MNKKILLSAVAAVTVFLSAPSFADDVCVGMEQSGKFVGPVYCGTGEIPSLQVYGGPVEMDGTEVSGIVDIAGPVQMTNTTINGVTTVKGILQASSATFNSAMNLATDTLTLTSSHAGDISLSGQTGQKVYLKSGTAVSGSITFISGGGLVFLSGGSHVDGQVIGGKVVHN
jgi:hypothetical protein